jgi:hypothetical protein
MVLFIVTLHYMKQVLSLSTELSYTDYIAHSLIQFAEYNNDFFHWFLQTIPIIHSNSTYEFETLTRIPFLSIHSEETAVLKANWLLHIIQNTKRKDTLQTQALLSAWRETKHWEEYSFIVLGLQYGVLNYGIIGHPKRPLEPLDVVVREDIMQSINKVTLARHALKLSMGIVEQGLVLAEGVIQKLEPELHNWFFGEKHTVFHTCSAETLTRLVREIKSIHAPLSYTKDCKGPQMLAISPALYVGDLQEARNLHTIE